MPPRRVSEQAARGCVSTRRTLRARSWSESSRRSAAHVELFVIAVVRSYGHLGRQSRSLRMRVAASRLGAALRKDGDHGRTKEAVFRSVWAHPRTSDHQDDGDGFLDGGGSRETLSATDSAYGELSPNFKIINSVFSPSSVDFLGASQSSWIGPTGRHSYEAWQGPSKRRRAGRPAPSGLELDFHETNRIVGLDVMATPIACIGHAAERRRPVVLPLDAVRRSHRTTSNRGVAVPAGLAPAESAIVTSPGRFDWDEGRARGRSFSIMVFSLMGEANGPGVCQ